MAFKVIIAGGRDFDDYELLSLLCKSTLHEYKEIEIVSGTAKGADRLGERYANENGYPIKRFPADWDKYGKGAGYIRNEEMAKYGDLLLAFWDGKSMGTRHMISLAEKHGVKIVITLYNKNIKN